MNHLLAAAKFQVGKVDGLSVNFKGVADAVFGRFPAAPFAAAKEAVKAGEKNFQVGTVSAGNRPLRPQSLSGHLRAGCVPSASDWRVIVPGTQCRGDLKSVDPRAA